jgi:hypothetical protein
MKVNIRAVIAAAVIAGLFAGVGFGQTSKDSKPRTITVAEARQLVYAMLDAEDWTKLPGFVLYESSPGSDQGFYFIHATYDSDGSGIGHYAVERTTGEVWDWAMCGRFTSPALQKPQQRLRKLIGLTDADYLKLRKPGFCEAGEVPQVLKMGRPRSDAFSKAVENRK